MKWYNLVIVIFILLLLASYAIGFVEGTNSRPLETITDTLVVKEVVEIDPVMRVNAVVTAYAPDSASCWPYNDGYTATMKDANLPGVAVDPRRIPFGSIVIIDGIAYEADDTGHDMRNALDLHVDLRFPTREEALEFGRQEKEIEVILR